MHRNLTVNGGNFYPAPFFSALLGSGALPHLEHLVLDRDRDFMSYDQMNAFDTVSGSLPSLRSLCVNTAAPPTLLPGLFAAAGPNLTTLKLDVGVAAAVGVELLAEEDYPWLPPLQGLSVKWAQPQRADVGASWEEYDNAELLVAALARLPALKTLSVEAPEYDELLVRLLAAAEMGALPSLTTLKLTGDPHGSATITNGALLLLLLWLKREAKKALAGQAPAALWDVRGLPLSDMPDAIKRATDNCLAQLGKARARV
jgi:hypothetical protein